jgi:hypothetical protein
MGEPGDGMIEIAVADNGPGIDGDIAGQLFRPFVSNWQLLRQPRNIKGLTPRLTLFPHRMISMRSLNLHAGRDPSGCRRFDPVTAYQPPKPCGIIKMSKARSRSAKCRSIQIFPRTTIARRWFARP